MRKSASYAAMPSIRIPIFCALALAATMLISGCTSIAEGWRSMARNQDAQARGFVETDSRNPSETGKVLEDHDLPAFR